MRKLYNEFFYIPKYGKIREKVMLVRAAMTIVVMVMCLAAISITAYAYFSHNVTSASNTIQAANFEANVSINGETVTTTKSGKLQTVNLEEAGIYTVELTKDESTANTGFCIITINNTDYFTQQIGNDVERGLTDGSASVVFTLKVSSATKIKILSHWGTSKYYGYKDEGRPEIFIDSTDFFLDLTNGEGDNSDGQDGSGTTTDTTTPPTTDTTTGSEPSNTTPPTTEPTGTSESTESTTEPAATESTDTTESTETQPTEETTGVPTTEASE